MASPSFCINHRTLHPIVLTVILFVVISEHCVSENLCCTYVRIVCIIHIVCMYVSYHCIQVWFNQFVDTILDVLVNNQISILRKFFSVCPLLVENWQRTPRAKFRHPVFSDQLEQSKNGKNRSFHPNHKTLFTLYRFHIGS